MSCCTVLPAGPHHKGNIAAPRTSWVLNKYYRTSLPIQTCEKTVQALNLWHHRTCLYECEAHQAGWRWVSAQETEREAGPVSVRMVRKRNSSKTMETTIFSSTCKDSSTCNGRSIPRPPVTKVNKMKYRSIIYTSHVWLITLVCQVTQRYPER